MTFSLRCSCLHVAGIILLISSSAQAGGFSNMEFGTRRMGMFAVTARPDDASAIFHNPAGLVLTPGTTAYLSAAWWVVQAETRLYDSDGKLHPDHNIVPDRAMALNPFLGFTTDFGTDRFRAGIAAYAPNVFGTTLPLDEPTRYVALEAIFIASRFAASAAFEITDELAIGANFNYLVMYLSADRMLNLAVLSNPDKMFDESVWETDGKLELEGFGSRPSWDVGLLYSPVPDLSFGAMFAAGVPVELEGDVKFTANDGSVIRTTHHTTMAIPFTFQGGVNWRIADDFELAADFRFWHYQVFQEQRTVLKEPILGIRQLVDPKSYHNSFNLGVGLLHRFAPGWEFMLGYQHDWSPIPNRSITPDSPNTNRHGVAMGVRWYALRGFRVGVAALRNWYDLLNNQQSNTLPPVNAKGTGANLAMGLDLSWTM